MLTELINKSHEPESVSNRLSQSELVNQISDILKGGENHEYPPLGRAEAIQVLVDQLGYDEEAILATLVPIEGTISFEDLVRLKNPELRGTRFFQPDGKLGEEDPGKFPGSNMWRVDYFAQLGQRGMDIDTAGMFARITERIAIIKVLLKAAIKTALESRQTGNDKANFSINEADFDTAFDTVASDFKIFAHLDLLKSFLEKSKITDKTKNVDSELEAIDSIIYHPDYLIKKFGKETYQLNVKFSERVEDTRAQAIEKIIAQLHPYSQDKAIYLCPEELKPRLIDEMWRCAFEDVTEDFNLRESSHRNQHDFGYMAAHYLLMEMPLQADSFFSKHEAQLKKFFVEKDEPKVVKMVRNVKDRLVGLVMRNQKLDQVQIQQAEVEKNVLVATRVLAEMQALIDKNLKDETLLLKVPNLQQRELEQALRDAFLETLDSKITLGTSLYIQHEKRVVDRLDQDYLAFCAKVVDVQQIWESIRSNLETPDKLAEVVLERRKHPYF